MVALLPYRGNDRNLDQRCPIDIAGLAKIHNAVTQFKIDNEHGGNFIQQLHSSKAVYKAAQAEWSGWQQYLPKHAARARNIEKGPREKPVIEGQDELVVNPPLLMRKGHVVGKMKCALTKSVANQGYGLGIGLPFLERFSTAHAVYATADLKKLSVEGANNFHHHASLLKIINKTGSLFRGLGALRLFSLSLSLSLLLSSYAVYVPFIAIAHWCPLR